MNPPAFTLLAILVLAGCPTPAPIPPPNPDASDAAPALGDAPAPLDDCQLGRCCARVRPVLHARRRRRGLRGVSARPQRRQGAERADAQAAHVRRRREGVEKTRADAVALGFVCP